MPSLQCYIDAQEALLTCLEAAEDAEAVDVCAETRTAEATACDVPVVDGWVTIPSRPGIGIDVDEAAVRRLVA